MESFKDIPTPLWIRSRYPQVLEAYLTGQDIGHNDLTLLFKHLKSNRPDNTRLFITVAISRWSLTHYPMAMVYVIKSNLYLLFHILYPGVVWFGPVIHHVLRALPGAKDYYEKTMENRFNV